MNKSVFFAVLCIVLLLCSCASSSHKGTEGIILTHVEGYGNNLFIGQSGYIMATQDAHLVGLEHSGEFYFYVQDINQLDSVFRFGRKGQGPGEYIHPFTLQYINDSLMGSYDVWGKRFYEISLNPHTQHRQIKSVTFDDNMSFRIIKTAYNQYIGIGVYPEGMFALYDSGGIKIKSFFEYPYKDSNERAVKNQLRAMAYQGKIVSNLSNTKFVYAAASADIIYLFGIIKDDIQCIKKIENRYSEYIPDEGQGTFSVAYKATNPNGCRDLYATDQFIYFLYSGKTYSEYKEDAFKGYQLRIYDWEGALIKEMALDIPCTNICVSPDDKTIWAIAEMPEPVIIQFDLSKIK